MCGNVFPFPSLAFLLYLGFLFPCLPISLSPSMTAGTDKLGEVIEFWSSFDRKQ